MDQVGVGGDLGTKTRTTGPPCDLLALDPDAEKLEIGTDASCDFYHLYELLRCIIHIIA